MAFRDLVALSWQYKKRNFNRLLAFDLQNLFVCSCIFTIWGILGFFSRLDFLVAMKKLVMYDYAHGAFAAVELFVEKETFEAIFWAFLIGLSLFLLYLAGNFSRMEFIVDNERLRNYYDRYADSRQIVREFILSRFLGLPLVIFVSTLLGFVFSTLFNQYMIQSLKFNTTLFYPVFTFNFIEIFTGWLFLAISISWNYQRTLRRVRALFFK